MTDSPETRSSAPDYLAALRPNQWTKNAVVFAAYIFALGDRHQAGLAGSSFWTVLAAAALF